MVARRVGGNRLSSAGGDSPGGEERESSGHALLIDDASPCSEGSILPGEDCANAQLPGANLTGTSLGGAVLCHTVMPSGQTNDAGC